MNEPLVQKLRRICLDVAHEIETACRGCDHAMLAAAVKARDALVEMRAAAGDKDAVRVMEEHYSLDEMKTMTTTGYSGVGCPHCGQDADAEGDGVEIIRSGARQEMSCGQCGKAWVNAYRFDGWMCSLPAGVTMDAEVTMNTENYGHELILDLHHCDADTFTRQSIGDYFDELCELIGMQAEDRHFWDDEGCQEEHCQTDPKTCGVSAVQFILTSTIVVHTLTKLNAVYVNIFSCKDFDEDAARQFTIQWFRAGRHHSTSVARR